MISAFLQRLLNVILQILGIASAIQEAQLVQATASEVQLVQTTVSTIDAVVTDVTYGNSALEVLIADLTTLCSTNFADILAAIALTQQAGSPVTLPTTPPTGYGGAAAGDIATAVWTYPLPFTDQETADAMLQIATFALNLGGGTAFPSWSDPKFLIRSQGWWNVLNNTVPSTGFSANYANILPTDTLSSWLARETGVDTWRLDPDSGYYMNEEIGAPNWTFVLPLSQADFEFVQLGYPPPGSATAPVWPGLSAVTLGTPLSLADGLEVPGPLDGVIYAITSVPTPISYYPFGPIKSFVRAGAIAFVDDNGDAEFPQPLAPANGVITPRQMQRADHAYVRLPSGVIGTITPWTLL